MSIIKEAASRDDQLARSKTIAGLVGPAGMALAITEIINLEIFRTNVVPLTYLNGTLLLIAGLAIVRVHNRWTPHWPVLVTLSGWGLVLGGLWRMFDPQSQQAPENLATYAGLALGFTFMSFMTYKAYGQEIWMKLSRRDRHSAAEISR